MQVVNKKMCVIVILVLVIIESCTLFLMYKSFSNKTTNLDEVNLNISNSNMFAIMLEQDDGTYKEDTTSTWPTSGYTYNADMSGCIDINGNKLDGVLSYDSANNIATVDTGNTSYCYLYFSLPPYRKQKSEMRDSPLEGDGYRYVGENPNNYICFGTTNKATCTSNTDLYMYRIIGIFEDNEGNEHLKIIKKEALNTAYKWHSDSSVEVDWNESDLYKGINGDYFLNNTTYSYMQNEEWTDKISEWMWNATDALYDGAGIIYDYNTPKTIYLHELNMSNKSNQICYNSPDIVGDCSIGNHKNFNGLISLMYISDFVLSRGEDYLETNVYGNNNFKFGWIQVKNNDSTPPSSNDWTMTRSGMTAWTYRAYIAVHDEFPVSSSYVHYIQSVRPVFYLTNDAKLISGTGLSNDPYIIG